MSKALIEFLLDIQDLKRKWKTGFKNSLCYKCGQEIKIYDFPLVLNGKFHCEKCSEKVLLLLEPLLSKAKLETLVIPKLLPRNPYHYSLPLTFPDGVMECSDCPDKPVKDIIFCKKCVRYKMRKKFSEENP